MKQNAKICAIGEQNVINRSLYLSIDQKRKKGWWRGRRERIEKGSRERIEIAREKRDKREFEEEDKEHRHLPLLISSRHCVSSELLTRFCSKALQQTVNTKI